LTFCSRSEQEKELEEEAVAETTGANTSEEAVADGVFF
jgi:cytoskeleton-associated protein 5